MVVSKKGKRGRLSKAEQSKIRELAQSKTPDQIAAELGKDPKMVRSWILENCLVSPVDEEVSDEQIEYIRLQKELRLTPEFQQLKEEMTGQELRYFEHRYAQFAYQFKDDITVSESSQLYQLIRFEIMMHRNMVTRQKSGYAIKRMEEAIAKLYKQCGKDITQLTDEERNYLSRTEETIAIMRNASHASVKEYAEMQKENNALLKALRATREQRISKAENLKQTFVELIKSLQDQEVAEREGRQLEILKLATEKEYKRLSKPHKYLDQQVDCPILNSEIVTRKEPEDEDYSEMSAEDFTINAGDGASPGVLGQDGASGDASRAEEAAATNEGR